MPGKKKSFRCSKSFTLPMAPIAGLIYGMTNGYAGGSVVYDVLLGRPDDALKQFSTGMGFNAFTGKIDFGNARILQGLFLGGLVHVFASKLGINRALKNVPILRI